MNRLLLAGAVVLTGCGSAASSTISHPAGTPSGAATTATQEAPLDQRFLVLANFVCRTVRTGAPKPLAPATTRRELITHATAATAPAQRTAVSLGRLAAKTSHQTALAPLVAGYRSLGGLYRAALVPKLTTAQTFAVARATVETEQLTGTTARSLGLPACAPVPPGP